MDSVHSDYDTLLAQFPGPVAVYPDRQKLVALVVGMSIICVGGFVGLYLATTPLGRIVGLVLSMYFLLCFLRFVRMLILRMPLVRLRSDDVSSCTSGLSLGTRLRDRNLKWSEIKAIYVIYRLWPWTPRIISINYLLENMRPQPFPYTSLPKIQPGDVDQLVQFLNGWRERALAASAAGAAATSRR